jgi:hypothetical protein
MALAAALAETEDQIDPTRGFSILLARLIDITHEFLHFAITLLEEKRQEIRIHSHLTDRIPSIQAQKPCLAAIL